MEKKVTTTISGFRFRGILGKRRRKWKLLYIYIHTYIRVYFGLYKGHTGIMEKKMETTGIIGVMWELAAAGFVAL